MRVNGFGYFVAANKRSGSFVACFGVYFKCHNLAFVQSNKIYSYWFGKN